MSRSIGSLKKASQILNLFLTGERALGISEFSRKLAMPKATVQSLVRTLEEIGYLEKDPDTSRYLLGPLLYQLGMKYAAGMDLTAVSRIWMEKLCTRFGGAVQMGILVGDRVVLVLRIEPEQRFMSFPVTGTVIPFNTSSIGKILFAYMDPAQRDRCLETNSLQVLTERSISDAGDFLAHLELVRRQGIAFDCQESVAGLSCVGAPIFNNRGQVIAAFSLSGRHDMVESQKESIVQEIRSMSLQISRLMGYNEGTRP
ncbi:MAG: IclR family transcriptional regulator [Spirochaetes bacterium]|nr:IclR family transcriptional regulator [Spirochaetota bacterium]